MNKPTPPVSPDSCSHPPDDRPEQGPKVPIIVNNVEFQIRRGRRTVVDIKTLAGVTLAHELEQIIDGKPTPLPDDGAVTIKGGERFISHPRDASAS